MAIFDSKYPQQDSSLPDGSIFHKNYSRVCGGEEGCFIRKGGFFYAEILVRTGFTGSTEYSSKWFSWFQVTPEPGKGALSKALGTPVPQPPVSTVQIIAFSCRASLSVQTSSYEYFACLCIAAFC